MKIPDSAYARIRDALWAKADEIGWTTLADPQKSGLYEEWLRDPEVGGVLSRYLDAGSIRVYIKDTIMKPYGRERLKDPRPVFAILGLAGETPIAKEFIKPHGRLLRDGRVVCWGLARDWKAILISVFERAHRANRIPHAAVLMYPNGRSAQPDERGVVEEVGRRLGIARVQWYDA